MNSNYMKAVLLCHFRYKKGLGMIASEAGYYNSDVLAVTKKHRLIEIEIKTSKTDLNADFKKRKHQIYKQHSGKVFVPHYFYFAIPANDKKLIEYALTKIVGTPYGLVLIQEMNGWTNHRVWYEEGNRFNYEQRIEWLERVYEKYRITKTTESKTRDGGYINYQVYGSVPFNERIRFVKKATRIHNNKLDDKVYYTITQRMGSEIATLRRDKALKEIETGERNDEETNK